MDIVEIAEVAQDLLDLHRDTLHIDPFIKISVEIVVGDYVSQCKKDLTSVLSWIVRLNPERHNDLYDVQYSIFEAILNIMFSEYKNGLAEDEVKEVTKGIISRLATSFSVLFEEDEEMSEEEDEEDD